MGGKGERRRGEGGREERGGGERGEGRGRGKRGGGREERKGGREKQEETERGNVQASILEEKVVNHNKGFVYDQQFAVNKSPSHN